MPSSPSSSCLGPRRSSSAGAAALPDDRSGWTALLAAIVERAQADVAHPAADLRRLCHGDGCPWDHWCNHPDCKRAHKPKGRHDPAPYGCHEARLCARTFLWRVRTALADYEGTDHLEPALAAVGALR
jgi:hypothetical protein